SALISLGLNTAKFTAKPLRQQYKHETLNQRGPRIESWCAHHRTPLYLCGFFYLRGLLFGPGTKGTWHRFGTSLYPALRRPVARSDLAVFFCARPFPSIGRSISFWPAEA